MVEYMINDLIHLKIKLIVNLNWYRLNLKKLKNQ